MQVVSAGFPLATKLSHQEIPNVIHELAFYPAHWQFSVAYSGDRSLVLCHRQNRPGRPGVVVRSYAL